jgi:hypothetical protein
MVLSIEPPHMFHMQTKLLVDLAAQIMRQET